MRESYKKAILLVKDHQGKIDNLIYTIKNNHKQKHNIIWPIIRFIYEDIYVHNPVLISPIHKYIYLYKRIHDYIKQLLSQQDFSLSHKSTQ